MRRFVVWFGDNISNAGLAVAAVGLIAIVAINGANVVARYIFSSPFSWAEEAMVFIAIAGVFWGAIGVAWRKIEIRIDAFIDLTAGRTRQILRLIASVTSIFILSWLFLVGSRVTLQVFEFDLRSPALNLPMWIPHTAFISGLLLIILMMLARLLSFAHPDSQTPDKGG